MLTRVRAATADHEASITAGLTGEERGQLLTLLRRIAAEQGLATQASASGQSLLRRDPAEQVSSCRAPHRSGRP